MKGQGDCTLLFSGKDRGAALEVVANPPSGTARTELYSNPQPTKRKFHEVKKPAAKKTAKKVSK